MTKEKKLKIIGGGVLLISFLTQTLLFDFYNEKSKSLADAYMGQAMIDKGAELKELKYFIARIPLDSISNKKYMMININEAAKEVAYGRTVQISVSDLSQEQKQMEVDSLMKAANSVYSFDDYMQFINYSNKFAIGQKQTENQLNHFQTIKAVSRILFIIFYLVGSILLLLSELNRK